MRFGERLVEKGLIDRDQLDAALMLQDQVRKPLGEVLLQLGYLDERSYLRILAQTFDTLYVASEKLARIKVSAHLLERIPPRLAREHTLFPISADANGKVLNLVSSEPQNEQGPLEARLVSGADEVCVFVARREVIEGLIRRFYEDDSDGRPAQHMGEEEEILIEVEIDDEAYRKADEEPDEQDCRVDAETALCPEPPPLPAGGPASGNGDLIEAARVLVNLLEQQVPGRAGHSMRVARLVEMLSGRLELQPAETAHNVLAALLHDLGRADEGHLTLIGIGSSQTLAHRAEAHRQTPTRLLARANLPEPVRAMLHLLYETGPSSLAAPAGARLIACADAFDDLTRNPDNPLGGRLSARKAIDLMRQDHAHQFDRRVVDVLDELVTERCDDRRKTNSRPLILVADPDAASCSLVQEHLQQAGYEVCVTHDSIATRDVITNRDVAGAIVATSLGPDDGFTVLEALQEPDRQVPVIMVGEDPDPYAITRAFKEGVADFISKPLKLDRLHKSMVRAFPAPVAADNPAAAGRLPAPATSWFAPAPATSTEARLSA